MLKKALALFALPIFLVGCASTQPIAQSDKAAVTAVVVSKDVPVPATIYYLGPGGATGLAFGAIGGALSASSIENDRTAFQQQTTGGKSIDAIVLEEMLAAIRKSRKFPVVDSPVPGAASIHVSVLSYGFSIPNGFSSELVPILALRCEMKDVSGRVLWSSTQRAMPLGNPVDSIPVEEIRTKAAVREKAWRDAARALASRMVESY